MTLHADEVPVSPADARRLIDSQTPQWRELPLTPAGHGTDNVMMRLGDDLLLRLPRRPSTAQDVAKEQRWLGHLAPHLPVAVPEPVFWGQPDEGYPFEWSVLRWIEGEHPGPGTVGDWERFGVDLAVFVRALHRIELAGATPEGALEWYRGRRLSDFRAEGQEAIDELRSFARRVDLGLDLDALQRLWDRAAGTPSPVLDAVWLHGDLRADNLLVRDGVLVGVIDFGCLSIGDPTAEHAALWEFPRAAREAYRRELGLDDDTWARATAWKVVVNLSGIPYYWESWPEFAQGCLETVQELLAEVGAG
ncbi:aminoglycoside phosphotransferase family protein [Kytococcus sedentarius]|uniref:aminoglycoside phosphotransferase family protein n=1 Tax=Kytococcus sedentarius TaxID=1276 RepID=UPI0035BBDF8A